MNSCNPIGRNPINIGSKKLPSIPSFTKFGGRQMQNHLQTPKCLSSRNFAMIPLNTSMTFEDGYASAMEPMDSDEWEYEENRRGNAGYKVESNSTKRKSHTSAPMESFHFKKNVKNTPFSKIQQASSVVPNFMEKRLVQSVLNLENSNVISIKLDPNQRKFSSHLQINSEENGKKLFPRWSSLLETKVDEDKELTFPRLLTVTVEKLLKWPKIIAGAKVLFELYGILDSISTGKYSGSKRIYLKSETMKESLMCTFYEIDRHLPSLQKGHWQRCIILLRCNGDYQCLKVRSASSNELKILDKMVTASGKAKALLLKTVNK